MLHSAWLLVQLQAAMILGAVVCFFVGGALRGTATFADAYHPGTPLYFAGDVFFLTAPVAIWMLRRDSARRHAVALCLAMLIPVAATLALGQALRHDYLVWLVDAMYPLMTLGAMACLVFAPSLFERMRPRRRT